MNDRKLDEPGVATAVAAAVKPAGSDGVSTTETVTGVAGGSAPSVLEAAGGLGAAPKVASGTVDPAASGILIPAIPAITASDAPEAATRRSHRRCVWT